ncbi:dihydrofolate reductase family protein [Allokutzneria sp. A3M-2-11 16]|uniref:dihydrofolate reductase family protein n=1 Tax=Allokutzneria sp. A3M-2-11 16 TaxID=2962043 RepID=UPI0020B73D50|nr:dihydrofolate reductase family protein [Allokutzneria sp. A3M-2-11 16]MCP3800872.1 dihydrofolate reductase family protein [Allokutzneria sp. A3M-2-11 16]
MTRIVHFVHQSADGFIHGPNGEFDWPMMGPELSAYSQSLTNSADAFLYGRVVWELMSSYWPKAEEYSTHEHDLAFAPVWRETPKVVVSRTLTEAGWNTRIVGDVAELADLGQKLVLFGGSDLAASLTERDMIDEYQVFVHPVVLGGGKPVFRDPGKRFSLKLAESRVFDAGVVLLRYQR